MTTKNKLKKMLTDRGMSEYQASVVLAEAISQIEKIVPEYDFTWDRPAEEYPEIMYDVFWLTLKDVAKKWIAENAPKAWFRPMFD